MIRDLNRRVEDLDNSDRRDNVHDRGLPESVLLGQRPLQYSTTCCRGPPPQRWIQKGSIGPLRPRVEANDPAKDVICCIVSFSLKENPQERDREHI